jgi:tetratricopeptide (TPR) repeat protein
VATLLGRDAELGALEGALGDARAGHGRLFLLVGEPGIGKTRLADELCARAPADVRVLWGRCWEAEGAPAYWPWVEILRPLVEEEDATRLAAALGSAAAALATLLPELRGRLPGLPADAPGASDAARFALYDAIARFLRAAAARAPLLLVLDDLHVADRPSLRLLSFIARGLRGARILIVATCRDADARLGPEAATLLAEVEREGQRFPLRRLRHDEVAALLAGASGAAAEPALVDAIVQATEGTPLFVTEVVRLVVAHGLGAGEGLVHRVLVPDGVQPTIRGHLARVSDATRAALRVAAVVGREFSVRLLEAAHADPAGALGAALAEAEQAGLVATLDGGARYRFNHILIRETIYKDLGAAERARLHAAVGAALEATSAAGDPDRLSELAHHFGRAGLRADPSRAVRYARAAGERALSAYAHEEAAGHFQHALEALPPGDDVATRRTRAELRLAQADAHQRGGERARATTACDEAAALARTLGDAELLGRIALRRGAEYAFAFVDPALVGMLEEALTGTPGRTPLRARLMARLAAARQPAPNVDEPIALAREAVALARALNDRPTLAAVLRDARAAYLAMDDLDERLALDLETLALGYETGDKLATLEALRRLAGERIEQGELDAALGHIDQLDRLADELRQGHRRWWTLGLRASIASLRGGFAEAEQLLDEADAVATVSGDPNGPAMAGLFRVSHAWTSMRPDQLARGRADVLRALSARGFADDQIFSVIVDVGLTVDRDEARALLHRLPFERYHPRFNGQHLMAFLVARAGQTDALPVMYQRLHAWASRFPCATGCQGSYSGVLGMMAEAMGRTEEARRHFAHALAENRRIGARPEVARVASEYARFLNSAGGAASEAAALRAEALAIARELGMPALLVQLGAPTEVAPAVPAVAAATAPVAVPDPTFTLEGEYWTVAYAGESFRFKDSKAFQIVAYLVRNPGREFHVLHLAGIAGGSEGGEVLIEGTAGATPDAEARALYRERVEDLRATLAEAESNGDLGRAERAREELDFIAEELSRGMGLGGRERAGGSSAERARINIQRRVANAIKKIGEVSPALGRRLGRGMRTGAYCAWEGA